MLLATYLMALGVWVAWIYVQHNYGDRPTNYVWFAAMTSLGVVEYSKSINALVDEQSALVTALGLGFAVATFILAQHARRVWRENAEAEATADALPAAGQ